MSELPKLTWSNRQRRIRADWRWVRRVVSEALPAIASVAGPHRDAEEVALWSGGGEIHFAMLDDRRMGELHERFLGDPATTDVITFRHGEIAIGAEVAQRAAIRLGVSVERELALYAVHGLLHLRGFEDETAEGALSLRRVQSAILRAAIRQSSQ